MPAYTDSTNGIKIPRVTADKIYPAYCEKMPSLEGKCVAITGTTSGTGYWTSLAAVKKNVGALLLLNRQSSRSIDSYNELSQVAGPKTEVHAIDCDLTSFESVRVAIAKVASIAAKFGGLDVLCLNAGVSCMPDDRTVDGYDLSMQINHLSHSIMVDKLMPQLEKAAQSRGEARIAYMTSSARFLPMKPDFKFGGKHFEKCPPDTLGGNAADLSWQTDRYIHAKIAVTAYFCALHDKLAASGSKVKVLCADPGAASTSLQTNGLKEEKSRKNASACFVNCAHFVLFDPKCCGILQSGGDGACPLIECCFFPGANSGDLYAPTGSAWFIALYTKGVPRKVVEDGKPAKGLKGRVFEEVSCSEENKKAAWDRTQECIKAF
jgi:NAD(P)-dependent dehydrogenase (short-subunit alcohol dehydrogenase family)